MDRRRLQDQPGAVVIPIVHSEVRFSWPDWEPAELSTALADGVIENRWRPTEILGLHGRLWVALVNTSTGDDHCDWVPASQLVVVD